MKKEFIPYEQALALKELGFNEPCLGFYDGKGSTQLYFNHKRDASGDFIPFVKSERLTWFGTPTYSQAFRFFREKYGLKHDIDDDNVGTKFYYRIRSYTDKFDNYDDIIKPMREEKDWAKIEFKTYEEAELACLIKLIEIVKADDSNT